MKTSPSPPPAERSSTLDQHLLPPACEGSGEGVLFWYGATRVAEAVNSRRYRIHNRMEQLPASRHVVGRTIPDAALHGVHTVVSLRPYVDAVAARQLDRLRARGIALIADYDDLLFDCPLEDYPASGGWLRRLRVPGRLQVYRESVEHFDAFTTSTRPIADALYALRPNAEIGVVPNKPSPSWVARGWARFGDRAWRPGDPRVIRYLPGSPSHDRDFAVIEEALVAFLHEHEDVTLEVVGYLHFNHRRFPRGRVLHRPKVDYESFPEVLLSTWVNLVPLAPTPYSQARSALKLLEAAAFGVPSIATPSYDHARTVSLPSPIRFATSSEEWLGALEEAHLATPEDPCVARSTRVPSEVPPAWSLVQHVGAGSPLTLVPKG